MTPILTKSKQIIIVNLVLAIMIPGMVLAGHLSLPKDSDGWTVFTPSTETDVVYISTNGNDGTCTSYRISDGVWEVSGTPFEPDSSEIRPCRTFSMALQKTGDNQPDWILFKRGETFTMASDPGAINLSGSSVRGGKNATEPFLISSYGTSGACPVIQTGSTKAIRLFTSTENIAFMGLDFYAHTRDPYAGGAVPAGNTGFDIAGGKIITGILVEGCKFRFFEYGIGMSGDSGDVDVHFRRNIISDNYGSNDSQGMFTQYVDDIILEENYFIRNGWRFVSSSNGRDRSGGQATIWNHSIYCNSTNKFTVRGNVFIDPSAACIKLTRAKMTTSTSITDNLFIGGEYVISAGNNYQEDQHAYHFKDFTVSNNVATHGGRGNHTNSGLSSGLWLCGLDGGVITNNLFINNDSSVTTGNVFATNSDESRDVIWSGNIAYNCGKKQGLRIAAGSSGSSNIKFINNAIQLPDLSNEYVVYAPYDSTNEWSFSDNIYYADSQSFFRNGSTVNLSGWNNWSQDTGSWLQKSFTDVTRDLDTYMQSIGKTDNIDAFIAAARAQDRYNWDMNYSAKKVNAWIKAGFHKPIPSNVRF